MLDLKRLEGPQEDMLAGKTGRSECQACMEKVDRKGYSLVVRQRMPGLLNALCAMRIFDQYHVGAVGQPQHSVGASEPTIRAYRLSTVMVLDFVQQLVVGTPHGDSATATLTHSQTRSNNILIEFEEKWRMDTILILSLKNKL